MQLKVLTLNTWMFQFYDKIVNFLKTENPDIIFLQEVSSGAHHPITHGKSDGYESLRTDLPEYFTAFTPFRRYLENDRFTFMGTAVFSKVPFLETASQFYFEHFENIELGPDERVAKGHVNFPGMLLKTYVEINSKKIGFFSTHFLWSMHPGTTDRQIEASKNLAAILEKEDTFIFGGDLNITDESQVYETLSKIMIDDRPEGITHTLNREIHPVGYQKDIAVDFLFHKGEAISKNTALLHEVDVSDHLPISVVYEV